MEIFWGGGGGNISFRYIFFKKYGKEKKIDWRLLASIAFQESTFNTEGQSWAGAAGLMGLMPETAASVGLDQNRILDPDSNIRAGTEYLKSLLALFRSVENPDERLKMALASYNAGVGHVFDARALAEKYEADKNVWEGNVEKYILLKRLKQYYADPVCKNGYFRGDETVNYVRNVIGRWEFYKEKVKE